SPLIRLACFMKWLVFWSMVSPPVAAPRTRSSCEFDWIRSRFNAVRRRAALTPGRASQSIHIGQTKRWTSGKQCACQYCRTINGNRTNTRCAGPSRPSADERLLRAADNIRPFPAPKNRLDSPNTYRRFCSQSKEQNLATTFEKVAKIIADTSEIDIDTITPESHTIDDLGIDSLDFLDIVFAIDKEFGIKVPLETWTQEVNDVKVSTDEYFVMKNLCATIDGLVAAKNAGSSA